MFLTFSVDEASVQVGQSHEGLRIALCQWLIIPKIPQPSLTLRVSQSVLWERGCQFCQLSQTLVSATVFYPLKFLIAALGKDSTLLHSLFSGATQGLMWKLYLLPRAQSSLQTACAPGALYPLVIWYQLWYHTPVSPDWPHPLW